MGTYTFVTSKSWSYKRGGLYTQRWSLNRGFHSVSREEVNVKKPVLILVHQVHFTWVADRSCCLPPCYLPSGCPDCSTFPFCRAEEYMT